MILCRCGYEAADPEDLDRHVMSWLNWLEESGQGDRALEHVED